MDTRDLWGRIRRRAAAATMAIGLVANRTPDGWQRAAQLGKSNVDTTVAVGGTAVGAGAMVAAKTGCSFLGKGAAVAVVEGGAVMGGKTIAVGVAETAGKSVAMGAAETAGNVAVHAGTSTVGAEVGEVAATRLGGGLGNEASVAGRAVGGTMGDESGSLARGVAVAGDNEGSNAGRALEGAVADDSAGHGSSAVGRATPSVGTRAGTEAERRVTEGVRLAVKEGRVKVSATSRGAHCLGQDAADALADLLKSAIEDGASAARDDDDFEEGALRALAAGQGRSSFVYDFAVDSGVVALQFGAHCLARADVRPLLRAGRRR